MWQSQGCGSAFISADPDPADILNADLDLAGFLNTDPDPSLKQNCVKIRVAGAGHF